MVLKIPKYSQNVELNFAYLDIELFLSFPCNLGAVRAVLSRDTPPRQHQKTTHELRPPLTITHLIVLKLLHWRRITLGGGGDSAQKHRGSSTVTLKGIRKIRAQNNFWAFSGQIHVSSDILHFWPVKYSKFYFPQRATLPTLVETDIIMKLYPPPPPPQTRVYNILRRHVVLVGLYNNHLQICNMIYALLQGREM